MTSVIGSGRVSLETALARYESLTPRSRAHFARAVDSLAGGTTRTTVFFDPYPPVIARGEGFWIEDLDGNRRVDFLNNYTSLILGHAHPAVVEAVIEQTARGTAFAAPTENERRLAELICRRVPSIERLRFANSGTEATLFAIRLARAFTRRDKILIFENGYHGTHDYVAVSSSAGIPDAVRSTVVSAPFNDLDSVAQVVRANGADLAAILVEPVQGAAGVLLASIEFLRGLRELASANGSLLIFDEVISLRLAPGGAQEVYDVRPDLTTLGKIIGGGFPIAAFGGRADVMALLDPRGGSPAIPHGGTFNGNPVGTAAGIATLEALTPDVYARLNMLGDQLRSRLADVFTARGGSVSVTGNRLVVQSALRCRRSAAGSHAGAAQRRLLPGGACHGLPIDTDDGERDRRAGLRHRQGAALAAAQARQQRYTHRERHDARSLSLWSSRSAAGRAAGGSGRRAVSNGSWAASLVAPADLVWGLPDDVPDRLAAITEPLRAPSAPSTSAPPLGGLRLPHRRRADWIAHHEGGPGVGSVGLPATIEQAIALAAPGGTVAIVAVTDLAARRPSRPRSCSSRN